MRFSCVGYKSEHLLDAVFEIVAYIVDEYLFRIHFEYLLHFWSAYEFGEKALFIKLL